MVEVGFKIAIALVSLDTAIRAINSLSSIGLALPISIIIMFFYLISTENIFIAIIAYTALCISISITYRPISHHIFHKLLYYIEKTTLYITPTVLLLLILKKHSISLVYVVAVVAILLIVMELRIATLSNVGASSTYLPKKLKNIDAKIRLVLKFIDTLSRYTSTKIRGMAIGLAKSCLKFMNILSKIEDSISRSIYRVPEVIINLTQNLVKIEKRSEDFFHRIAEAVEALQHKMEHSFILLLFLMGLLLLIAIVFYILLLTI